MSLPCCLVGILCLVASSAAFFSLDSSVSIAPETVRLNVGEELNLFCSVSNFTSDGLYFFSQHHRDSDYFANFTAIVNGSTAVLHIQKVPLDLNGWVQCRHINHTEPLCGTCTSTVAVHDPGLGIVTEEDLRCMSNSYMDFICTWCPENYENRNEPVHWFLSYSISSGRPDPPRGAPGDNNCTYILWSKELSPTTDNQVSSFHINITSLTLTNQETFQFIRILSMETIKPGPVEQLVVGHITSTTAEISWSPPNGLGFLGDELNYTVRWQNQKTYTIWEHKTQGQKTITIHSLRPYTSYEVIVYAEPAENGYISDPRKKEFQTLSAAPEEGPTITIGSFKIVPPNQLIVYWQELPRSKWNGPNVMYRVCFDKSLQGCKNVFTNITLMKSFDFSGEINVFVAAFNEDGIRRVSPYSSIHVRRQKPSIPVMTWHEVQSDETSLLLRWNHTDSDVTTFTMFSCKPSDSQINICTESTSTVVLQAADVATNNTAEFTYLISDYNPSLVYGLSANAGNLSSGLAPDWIDVCYQTKAPGQPEILPAESSTNSIRVRWKAPKCERGKQLGMAVNYTVTWNLTGGGVQWSVTVPASPLHYTISNLTTGQSYDVVVVANGHIDSTASKMVPMKTSAEDRKVVSIIAMSVAITVTALIVVAIVVCMCRKAKKWTNEKIPIECPTDVETQIRNFHASYLSNDATGTPSTESPGTAENQIRNDTDVNINPHHQEISQSGSDLSEQESNNSVSTRSSMLNTYSASAGSSTSNTNSSLGILINIEDLEPEENPTDCQASFTSNETTETADDELQNDVYQNFGPTSASSSGSSSRVQEFLPSSSSRKPYHNVKIEHQRVNTSCGDAPVELNSGLSKPACDGSSSTSGTGTSKSSSTSSGSNSLPPNSVRQTHNDVLGEQANRQKQAGRNTTPHQPLDECFDVYLSSLSSANANSSCGTSNHSGTGNVATLSPTGSENREGSSSQMNTYTKATPVSNHSGIIIDMPELGLPNNELNPKFNTIDVQTSSNGRQLPSNHCSNSRGNNAVSSASPSREHFPSESSSLGTGYYWPEKVYQPLNNSTDDAVELNSDILVPPCDSSGTAFGTETNISPPWGPPANSGLRMNLDSSGQGQNEEKEVTTSNTVTMDDPDSVILLLEDLQLDGADITNSTRL